MNEFDLYLGPINGTIKVNILRKRIKNVHLKVFRSLSVVLSVPELVPDEWIQCFLLERVKWIDDQITKYKKTSGYNNLLDIKNGSSIQYLGKYMRIYKESSLSNNVEVDEKRIHLFVIDKNDEELIQKVFNKWWRQTAREVYQSEVDSYYDKVIRKYNVDKPSITIKKMKTLVLLWLLKRRSDNMKRELLDNGNIWQKSDGRWIGLVRYKDEFGVTQRKSFSSKKKKTLQAKMTEYVKKLFF